MGNFNRLKKMATFLFLGTCLMVLLALAVCFLVDIPAEQFSRHIEKMPKKVDIQDPLLTGTKVQLAAMNPLPKTEKEKQYPAKQPKQLVAATFKKKIQTTARSKSIRKQTVTVQPTRSLLARGKLVLEQFEKDQSLPQITGDYGRLGFSGYSKALIRSGGKIVVFDWTATYGKLPLVELDSKTYAPKVKKLANYYLERPRLIQIPEPELAKALRELQQRSYPKAQLGAAFVLPNEAEYYILGAMEKVLQKDLRKYQQLHGEYRRGRDGKLVFTVQTGLRHGETRMEPLPQKITINFGYIS